MGMIGGKEVTMSGLDGDFSSAQRKGGERTYPAEPTRCQTHGGHPDRILFNPLRALHIAEIRKLRLR